MQTFPHWKHEIQLDLIDSLISLLRDEERGDDHTSICILRSGYRSATLNPETKSKSIPASVLSKCFYNVWLIGAKFTKHPFENIFLLLSLSKSKLCFGDSILCVWFIKICWKEQQWEMRWYSTMTQKSLNFSMRANSAGQGFNQKPKFSSTKWNQILSFLIAPKFFIFWFLGKLTTIIL